MGCSGSVKVKPAKTGVESNNKNGSAIIRGERPSIAEARENHEGEPPDQPNEDTNKIRRNSSRLSSGSNNQPPSLNELSSDHMNSGKKKKKKKKKSKETIIQKFENNADDDRNSESDIEILKVIETHTLKIAPQSLSYTKEEDGATADNFEAHAFGVGRTDSKFHKTLDIRASTDSVTLKTNANLFVNDIMSLALHQIDNEKKANVNTPEDSKEYVDERAKQVVDQILGNAMFVIKNETSSR